jgi:hypothetical protein
VLSHTASKVGTYYFDREPHAKHSKGVECDENIRPCLRADVT